MKKDYHYFIKNRKKPSGGKKKLVNYSNSFDGIIQVVIDKINPEVKIEEVKSHSRVKHIVDVRFAVYWVCFYVFKMPISDLSNLFNRHHSSFLNGLGKIYDRYTTEEKFKAKIEEIILNYN